MDSKLNNFNTIELDEKGIFCYEAPKKLEHVHFATMKEWSRDKTQNNQALEQAKRDRVYFKEQTFARSLFDHMEYNKPYPVPYGYKIEFKYEGGEPTNGPFGTFMFGETKYAILVPKEKVKPSWVTDDSGPEKELKQQSIEEAAVISNPYTSNKQGAEYDGYQVGYIAGAKSQAAKEYWYEQFKQEKL